jgi:hypothetical protein
VHNFRRQPYGKESTQQKFNISMQANSVETNTNVADQTYLLWRYSRHEFLTVLSTSDVGLTPWGFQTQGQGREVQRDSHYGMPCHRMWGAGVGCEQPYVATWLRL